jgi:hypothetical protein
MRRSCIQALDASGWHGIVCERGKPCDDPLQQFGARMILEVDRTIGKAGQAERMYLQ